MRHKLKFRILLLLIAGILLLSGMALPAAADEEPSQIGSAYDLAGQRIACLSTAVTGEILNTFFDGNVTIEYYNSDADMAYAVENDMVPAYMCNKVSAQRICLLYPDLSVLTPDVAAYDVHFLFNKENPRTIELCSQMSEFVERCRADGTLDELDKKWMGLDPSGSTIDIELTGENGTITWACSTSIGQPYCYLQNGEYVGYETELVMRFCQEKGYALKITDYDVSGMQSAVELGKCDFGGTSTFVSPEVAERLLLSSPHYVTCFSLVAKTGEKKQIGSAYDLSGQRVACLSTAVTGEILNTFFDGNVTIEYYNSDADMAYAVENDMVPAYMCNKVSAQRICLLYPDLSVLTPDVAAYDVHFLFNKENPRTIELCSQMSEFIDRCRADGTLDELDKKWMGLDPSGATIDIELTGENGTITWACSTSIGQPYCYMQDGEYVGYETELVMRFCQEKGYALKITDYDVSGMQSAVELGKCDFGGTSTFVSPEVAERLLLSSPHYVTCFSLVAKNGNAAVEKPGFFQSIAASFERTFIREARWKLFAVGIARTLIITVCSVVFGTLLGFAVYLTCRKGNRIANAITRFLTWLINGLPTVVLLMILFYVVFGKLSIGGLWVSVVAFTLIFAAAFQAMLRSGVEAIDYGQTEAAYALSYSDWGTFSKIVLPQAIRHFLPAYKAQIVALLKATSIVGYITVQDLTKVGEIVRASTYEAFFPLIAIAVLYFVMAGILIALVNAVSVKVDQKHRKPDDIMRGVNQHD